MAGVPTRSPAAIPSLRDLYSGNERGELPEQALQASLGCGNPTALAQLNAGETVLDLGSVSPRTKTSANQKLAVTVTRAVADDLEAVLRLLESVQLPAAGAAEHFGNFLVAKDEQGRLVGAIGLERYGTVGLLRSAAVAPECQRSGIGSKLTQARIDSAKAEGLKELVLFTFGAQLLAAKFGFTAANPETYRAQLVNSTQWVCCASAQFMRLGL